MNWRLFLKLAGIFLLASLSLTPAIRISAQPLKLASNPSASDVIDAVNSLRISHGLPAYSVNSILMGTAQGQADYMASIGSWSHTGPGGSSVTQRLLAAGYPLAGDLSLGGFRSENVVMGTGMTPEEAVSSWTGDDLHLHTMLSADLQEIGAGVAEKDGMVYYVIDCARPTGSGVPQAYTPGAEAALSGGENDIIIPVVKSTPDANGDVIHIVQAGQSLWQIATTYGVHIVDIQQLNHFSSTYVINPGDKLLIKKVGTATSVPPTLTATHSETILESTPTVVISTDTPTASVTPTLAPPLSGNVTTGGAVAAIAVVALAAAGLVAWAGRSRPI
jgi:uncharacterized protein YkwD/LysM repeat protein